MRIFLVGVIAIVGVLCVCSIAIAGETADAPKITGTFSGKDTYSIYDIENAARKDPEVKQLAFFSGRKLGKAKVTYTEDFWVVTFKIKNGPKIKARVDADLHVSGAQLDTNSMILAGAQYANSPLTQVWWWIAGSILFLVLLIPRTRIGIHHALIICGLIQLTALNGFSFIWNDGAHSRGFQTVVWSLNWVVLALLAVLLLMTSRQSLPSRPSRIWLPTWVIAAITVGATAVRAWYAKGHQIGSDVGTAGSAGAELFSGGADLYREMGSVGGFLIHGDTYPLLNYILYIPGYKFAQAFVDGPGYREASLLTTMFFDTACVLLLLAIGRSWFKSWKLGWWLAGLWVTMPLTLATLLLTTNEQAMVAFTLGALLFIHSPFGRGLFVGLGAGAKFVPLLFAAPLLRVGKTTDRKQLFVFVASVAVVPLLCVLMLLSYPGGVSNFYHQSIEFQLHRSDLASVWSHVPSWLRSYIAQPIALIVIASTVWFPKNRTPAVAAALVAVIAIVGQLVTRQWAFVYIEWMLAPTLVLLACLMHGAERDQLQPSRHNAQPADMQEA